MTDITSFGHHIKPLPPFLPCRILTSRLLFNSSNWYVAQDIYVMGVDDDVILESPYGSVVAMTTESSKEIHDGRNTTLTLIVSDTDEGT